jgi:hypothetical protein
MCVFYVLKENFRQNAGGGCAHCGAVILNDYIAIVVVEELVLFSNLVVLDLLIFITEFNTLILIFSLPPFIYIYTFTHKNPWKT